MKSASALSAVAAVLIAGPAAAKTELSSVTALQQNNPLARSFLENFVKAGNKAAKGLLQVKYVGGQEVVPPRKSANALKRGQFDILCAPTAYYIGTVPEGYALLASNQGPSALRKNGAWKILQEIYKKKAGAHLLAWGENMTSYHMYLSMEPKLKNGMPDLTGVKMRATGTYRPLFRALGASTINIKTSEIFTALQRGTVQGFGFTDIAVMALGFHKIVKYRVMPNFYQTNQVVTVNTDIWKGLTGKQRAFLTELGQEYETSSVIWIEKERLKEEALLKNHPMKDYVLKGKAADRYQDLAHQEIWKQFKKRSEYHDRLKPLMYIAGKPNRQVDLSSATSRLRK